MNETTTLGAYYRPWRNDAAQAWHVANTRCSRSTTKMILDMYRNVALQVARERQQADKDTGNSKN